MELADFSFWFAAFLLLMGLAVTGSTISEWDRDERLMLLAILAVGSALWPLTFLVGFGASLVGCVSNIASWFTSVGRR